MTDFIVLHVFVHAFVIKKIRRALFLTFSLDFNTFFVFFDKGAVFMPQTQFFNQMSLQLDGVTFDNSNFDYFI